MACDTTNNHALCIFSSGNATIVDIGPHIVIPTTIPAPTPAPTSHSAILFRASFVVAPSNFELQKMLLIAFNNTQVVIVSNSTTEISFYFCDVSDAAQAALLAMTPAQRHQKFGMTALSSSPLNEKVDSDLSSEWKIVICVLVPFVALVVVGVVIATVSRRCRKGEVRLDEYIQMLEQHALADSIQY